MALIYYWDKAGDTSEAFVHPYNELAAPYLAINSSDYIAYNGHPSGDTSSISYYGDFDFSSKLSTEKSYITKIVGFDFSGSPTFSFGDIYIPWNDDNLAVYSKSFLKLVIPVILSGNDSVSGSIFGDILYGYSGNDKIYGMSGNDLLMGGPGNDVIYGGTGRDIAQFSKANNKIDLSIYGYQLTGDGKDWLVDIEDVNGGSGNDQINGDSSNNRLKGQAGHDVLYGGLGDDLLVGGSGNDTVIFSKRNNSVRLTTTASQQTGDGIDRLFYIENVDGGGGRDVIVGNKKSNIIRGQSGGDSLFGGPGNDRLFGGSGNDNISGGTGHDYIHSGTGIDKVSGGKGRDKFSINKGSGHTIIKDFTDRQDKIILECGAKYISLVSRGHDALIYRNGDLLAVVEDSANDLQLKGRVFY